MMNDWLNGELKYAFIKSIPVMCGYVFLGIAFGISLQEAGYGWVWALAMSLFVFAGSMQFVMIPMMVSSVPVMTMAVTTLFVNCRHIFYGISFVESFRKMKQKLYMIFSLTDETYSVLCGCKQEDPEEKHRDAWFLIALIDQSYWVIGSVIGAWLGNLLPFDFTGIDFSMTALFIVILLEQVLGAAGRTKIAASIGLVTAAVFLIFFGTEHFLLPALLVTVFLLTGYCRTEGRRKEEGAVQDGN